MVTMRGVGVSSLSNHYRRFVQPLLPHFLTSFSIPTPFLKHLEADLMGHPLHTVVLMSQLLPHRHWLVSVEAGRFFTLGWNDFCLHLDLQIGDFLVFTYHSHLLFHVSVFDPVSACPRLLPSSLLLHHVLPGGSEINKVDFNSTYATEAKPNQSDNDRSSCVVKLTPYKFKNSILCLPVGFARENGLQFRRCEMMIIDGEKREWPVSLNYKKGDGQSYIKRGWKRFMTANRLKPGHDLCFQFLKGGSCPTLKCYRQNNTGEDPNTTCKSTPKKALAEDVTTSSSEQDQNQCLSCYVRLSSNSVKKSIIYFPSHFVRKSHLKCQSCEVKVVDEEERTWKVTLSCKSTSKAYFCRGWRDVQNANCFRPGNLVCFQLLEAGDRPIFRCYRVRRRRRTRFSKDIV